MKEVSSVEDDYDSDTTNFDLVSDEGWIEKRSSFNVARFGNAAMYVGKHFTTKLKNKFTYQNKEKDASSYVGKIISVVVKADKKSELFFKFEDCSLADSTTSSCHYGYYPCSNFMSSQSHVTFLNSLDESDNPTK